MMKRLKNAWKTLKENRGSGVVLVLVAISCITLMTTSLLHLSYTAFKMKAAERQNKVEFYEVNAKLDELVTELQNEVSAAINKAQKEVLINYSNPDVNRKTLFQSVLIDEVKKSVNPTKIENLMNLGAEGYEIKIVKDNIVAASSASRFTLRNVAITYISYKSGNSTTITTDIIVDVGDFEIDTKWDIVNSVKLENWKVE